MLTAYVGCCSAAIAAVERKAHTDRIGQREAAGVLHRCHLVNVAMDDAIDRVTNNRPIADVSPRELDSLGVHTHSHSGWHHISQPVDGQQVRRRRTRSPWGQQLATGPKKRPRRHPHRTSGLADRDH